MGCILCAVQSCKEGCNDKNAINYSSSATENNGTCLYCDSTQIANGSSIYEIEDENSQSPYYFQYVLRTIVTSQELQLNGNGCKFLGYGSGSNSCNEYSNNLQLVNVTSSKITFTGQLFINYESQSGAQTTVTYNFNSTQVGAFDTLKIGNIGAACVPGDFAFFQLNMNGNYSIQYN